MKIVGHSFDPLWCVLTPVPQYGDSQKLIKDKLLVLWHGFQGHYPYLQKTGTGISMFGKPSLVLISSYRWETVALQSFSWLIPLTTCDSPVWCFHQISKLFDSLTIVSGSTYATLYKVLSGRTLMFCVKPVGIPPHFLKRFQISTE